MSKGVECKGLTDEELEKFKDLKCTEEVKEVKKEPVLLGFDRVCGDLRKKFDKLGKSKEISSFHLLGAVQVDGVNRFSGGVVGDFGIVFEGLVAMCRQRPEIKTLVVETAKYLKASEFLKVSNIKELKKEGLLGVKLYKVLTDEKIKDLKELEKYTEEQVRSFKGFALDLKTDNLEELKTALSFRGLKFK